MSYIALAHVATGDLATAILQNVLIDDLDFIYNSRGLANCFRLTLSSGVPVPFTDVLAATTIYCTPAGVGNFITLYDAAGIPTTMSSAQFSIAVPATTNTNYDVFCYNNSGVPTLELNAWRNSGQAITGATNATPIVITANAHGLSNGDEVYVSGVLGNAAANGTWTVANVAANTYELSTSVGNGAYTAATGWFNARASTGKLVLTTTGAYTKTADLTRLYQGMIRTTGVSGQTEDSAVKRFTWNHYNRVQRPLLKQGTGQWNYTTATWRQANADATLQVEAIHGIADTLVSLRLVGQATNTVAGLAAGVQFGINSTTVQSQLQCGGYIAIPIAGVPVNSSVATLETYPAAGYNKFVWLEESLATGVCTFYGAAGLGAGGNAVAGISGWIR